MVAPLRAQPARTALLFDFDGTLAPIVAHPGDARPLPGAVDRLDRLAARYRTVAVISGRPVSFLADLIPGPVALSGLYGLEARIAGTTTERPGLEGWRVAVAEAVAEASAALPDPSLVEGKGLSLTLHYRTRPDLASTVLALADALGLHHGLEVRPAKRSVELHPPVAMDKGVVVRELAAGAEAALYVGDDVGDEPALAALRDLATEGVRTLGAVVVTAETAPSLRAGADVLLAGPDAVLALLDALLAEPDPPATS